MSDAGNTDGELRDEMNRDWVTVRVERFAGNPIVRPAMLPGRDGANINGPCLMRVPEWVPRPLGRYYLYFADHGGRYIRMAWADRLHGPYTVHGGGVLSVDQLPFAAHHVASPDILVDDAARTIRMYFHAAARDAGSLPTSGPFRDAGWSGQTTHVALSGDGLTFEPRADVLASFYLRVFRHEGRICGIAKDGSAAALVRSDDGLTTFERGPIVFERSRHWALWPQDDTLWALFSRIGDAPERLLVTRFDLRRDWTEWQDTAPSPALVLRSETDYEGARLPIAPSQPSAAVGVHQLRDPFVYEEDGRLVLFYSVAGELGLAAADLQLVARP